MDLDKFSSMKRKQIGNLILKILRNETYNSCRRVSLVAKMAKAKDVKHLKGSRKEAFEKQVNLALGDLQRTSPPKIVYDKRKGRVKLYKRPKRRPKPKPKISPTTDQTLRLVPEQKVAGGKLEVHFRCNSCGFTTQVDPEAPDMRCTKCQATLIG